ncbi:MULTISPECIES: sensor histidine kinase [unclassified Paenibacillus]|uniref:sensor histidine kinase n=1 Tax=unclassified Paenibacillus TaxID=185978 RepID=UPI002F3F39E6
MMKLFPIKKMPTTGFNLFQKLVVIFLIMIIPAFIISALINRSGEAAVSGQITSSLKSNAHFYLSTFEREMERVIRMKQQYMLDSTVQNLMRYHMIYSDSDTIYAIQEIERRLQQFKESSLFVHQIKLMLPELNIVIQNDRVEQTIPLSEQKAVSELAVSGKHIESFQEELIMGDYYPRHDMQEGSAKMWMEIKLSQKNMEKSLREAVAYNGGEAIIADRNSAWMIGAFPQQEISNRQFIEQLNLDDNSQSGGIGRFYIGQEAYVYAFEASSLLDAVFMVYMPEDSFLGPIKKHKQIYAALAATSVLVIVLFAAWIYNIIHIPMLRLTSAFRRLESGSFQHKLESSGKDEFNYLYKQFNKMSERLETLINDVYEHELRLKRSELKQLQAQINPHFLYNIFFLLNRTIQLDDIEAAKRLTKYLGQFFRFITRNKEDEVRFKEEVEHIEAYIGIQGLRFGRKLDAQIGTLPPEAMQVQVPRLILQPLVENAFEYGLEDHLVQGVLRVSFVNGDDSFYVHIEDNGTELSDDKLMYLQQQLSQQDKDTETTGLLNIDKRIKLKFGGEYGISLKRSGLGGLHVILRLPLHS